MLVRKEQKCIITVIFQIFQSKLQKLQNKLSIIKQNTIWYLQLLFYYLQKPSTINQYSKTFHLNTFK